MIAAAEVAADVLDRLGEEAWLSEALVVRATQLANVGRSMEAVTLLERALGYALRAGDLHRAHMAHLRLYLMKVYGATPISECIEFIERVPEGLQSTMLWAPEPRVHSALVAAYSGRFAEARIHYAAAKTIAADLGLDGYHIRMNITGGQIELLAGDPAAAEKELRWGFERLGERGETASRPTAAALLAEALVELGREADAESVLEAVESTLDPDDFDAKARTCWVRGRILARAGELEKAERATREAVDIVRRTDFVVLQGEALVAHAEVLRAAGSEVEAITTLREALDLFERKEIVVQVKRVRSLLASAGAPVA